MKDKGREANISVIIPNRDGRIYLAKCLDSLLKQSLKPLEIIVIDDASQDNSLEFLQGNYPEVISFPSSADNIPKGFAGTVNAGISAAKGDYIALLNNDTEVAENWLGGMYEVIKRYPTAASVSCKMYLKDGKHLNALGLMLEKGGSCRTIADGLLDDGQFEKEIEIFGPSGGAALWRKSVMLELGCFDNDYFAYYEDAALALRARLSGYISVYAPNSKMIHLEGRCPSLARFDKVALRLRNAVWFVWGNFPAEILLKNLSTILWETYFRHFFKYGPRVWKVEGRSFWKASWNIIKSLPKIRKMRKEMKLICKIPVKDIECWLAKNPFE